MSKKSKRNAPMEFHVREFDTARKCNGYLEELHKQGLYVKSVNTVFDSDRNRVMHTVVWGKKAESAKS